MRRRSLPIAVLFLPLLLGAFLAGRSARVRESIDLFNQVFSVVSATAVDSLPDEELYELAARGLVRELGDPYADLLSPEDRAFFDRNSIGNHYAGTGMTIRSHRGRVTAFRVFEGSPAQAAGMMPGDRIVMIGETSVVGWPSDSVTTLLLGPPDTDVLVTVERAGVPEPVSVKIRRAQIRVAAVPFTMMLENNIGYIPIQRFNEVAAADVAGAVIRLGQAGARGFVLDLRGNGGGDLYQSLRMAGLFLEPGSEVSRVQHRGQPPEIYRAQERPLLTDAPIAVLVDGASASASEIVAGSLQDHDRALIVGTRTFGKGLVQTQSMLDNDWAIRLTTGKWYTPSGRSIQAEHAALGDSRFVEDSTTDGERPTYRSTSGRTIIGGGGVTPDLVVTQDSASEAERDLAQAAGRRLVDLQDAVFEASRMAVAASPAGFVPSQAWRDSVWVRTEAVELMIPRVQFDAAHETIDRLIAIQVAGLVAGDSGTFNLRRDSDRVLEAALERVTEARDRTRLLGLNN